MPPRIARGRPPAPPLLGPFAQYSPYAWLLPEELWNKPKRTFAYSVEFVTPNQLVATGTRTRGQGVDRDSMFACVAVAATVTNVDNTTFIDSPAILVQITTGTSTNWFEPAAHFLNVFGRGAVGDGRINYLELPRLIDPGANISVTLENLDATARHVRLAFRGFRVYGM